MPCVGQFPGRQAGALQQRPRLVGEHRARACPPRAPRRSRRAPCRSRRSPGRRRCSGSAPCAPSGSSAAPARPMRPAHGDVLVVDGARLGQQRRASIAGAVRPRPPAASPRRACGRSAQNRLTAVGRVAARSPRALQPRPAPPRDRRAPRGPLRRQRQRRRPPRCRSPARRAPPARGSPRTASARSRQSRNTTSPGSRVWSSTARGRRRHSATGKGTGSAHASSEHRPAQPSSWPSRASGRPITLK